MAEKDSKDSKELLLAAAKLVFAAKGFDGATVKDLADEAGVNVSLVSYHFGGKENLYRTCLEGFGTARLETAQRILKPAETEEEFRLRLRLFAEDFLEIHRREPRECKMVQAGMDSLNPIALETFRSIFFKIFDSLRLFIEAGRKHGFIKSHMDSQITAAMMFGSLMHVIRSQELTKLVGLKSLEDRKHAASVIEHWLEINTLGLFPRPEKSGEPHV